MSIYKENDMLSVLLALEKRILRKLQVASLGVITKIDTSKKECGVRLFPADEDTKPNEIYCKYAESLETDLTLGSIVVVLFLNKDTRANLLLFENDIDNTIINSTKSTHVEKNGVVIQIFRKKEGE